MNNINNKKTIFFDGAFGTYYSFLSNSSAPCELANINDKNTVINIHKQYINSGATAIKTNTFGANFTLTTNNLEIQNIIKSGYEIALEASMGTDAHVFADIGYINSIDENTSDAYLFISKAFIDCGANHFLFETLAEFDVIKPSLNYIKFKIPNSTIIVSFAVSQDGYSKKGLYYKDLLLKASESDYVDVVGLNCICGPSHLYNLISSLNLNGKRFCAMPNSGYPSYENGRTFFQDNAEYFSQKLMDIYNLGVNIVGGCCGTTPEHIRLSVEKILGSRNSATNIITGIDLIDNYPINENQFSEKLLSNKKVIAVEIDPPINTNSDFILQASTSVKDAGADIITLADSPLARTHADSVILAAKVKREIKIDVLPHISCRDKNQIGIKASLLGANIENINNVLVVTGDPVSQTDRATSKGVFNFNSFDLISYIKSMNTEVFSATPFYIGGALNVNSLNFDIELGRAKRKVESGAGFLLTQPIFSDRSIENLRIAKKYIDCKLLAGILPVASYKNALFLKNEVSGIDIPENIINLLINKTPQEVADISISFCIDIVKKTKDTCDGYYLMTPLKKVDIICDLIKRIKNLKI